MVLPYCTFVTFVYLAGEDAEDFSDAVFIDIEILVLCLYDPWSNALEGPHVIRT